MPTLAKTPADLGLAVQYYLSGSVITTTLDLGATPRTRPVMVHSIWDGPTGTAVTSTRVADSANGLTWGDWQTVGADETTPFTPRRYLQVEITLTTIDAQTTPTLTGFGVFD